MNVLVAMDSFKGSASSNECGRAVSAGIKKVYEKAEILTIPIADGGEGTVEAFIHQLSGEVREVPVTGPLGGIINAAYGIAADGETAIIEVASACGLPLIREGELNPLVTTTYGIGELIGRVIQQGCRDFIIGLGGSSTNDAGVGMLQAHGFRFLDSNRQEVGFGGEELKNIQKIDSQYVNEKLKHCSFQIACDVNNALYGEYGAAFVFGPQKGATEDVVVLLDDGLRHFAEVVYKEMGTDLNENMGAGAAGGLGAAFHGFLNGKLQPGIDLMLENIGVKERY